MSSALTCAVLLERGGRTVCPTGTVMTMLPRQTRETADRGLPLKTTQNKSKQKKKNLPLKEIFQKSQRGSLFLLL